MDKYRIPNVKVGSGANTQAGRAFNGVIYGVDISMGSDGDPTNITLNVALDSAISGGAGLVREFEINNEHLDLESPVPFKLNDVTLFHNIFLNGFTESSDPSSKTLVVDYVDGAILLDRIFVGALHEHVDGSGFGQNLARWVGNHPYQIEIPARCPVKRKQKINADGDEVIVCDHSVMQTTTGKAIRHLKSVNRDIAQANSMARRIDKRNIWKGGYILIGREEFTEQTCSLKDVSYTFHDLIAGIKAFGILVDHSRFTGYDILLTKNYTGTVKDVLQNWMSDLGAYMRWDFQSARPKIVIMRNGDSDEIEKNMGYAIDYIKSQDKREDKALVINSSNKAVSLDGTYSQAYSSIFNIGPSAKETNRTTTTNVTFTNEGLDTISGVKTDVNGKKIATKIYNGRQVDDIYISCGLGKFSPELRDIYNARKGINIIDQIKGGYSQFIEKEKDYMPYFEALGFRAIFPLTFGPLIEGEDGDSNAARRLRDNIWSFEQGIAKLTADTIDFGVEQASAAGNKGEDMGQIPNKIHFFIGFYEDNLKSYTTQLEQKIANQYLGKHYTMQAPFSQIFDDRFCPYQKTLESLKTVPATEYFAHNEYHRSPMHEFIEDISDLQISFDNDSYENVLFDKLRKMKRDISYECKQEMISNARNKGFFYFNRQSAAWATFPKDIKNLLNPWTLILDDKYKDGPENISNESRYRSETLSKRVRKNILKNYVPTNHPLSVVPSLYVNVDDDDSTQLERDLRDYFASEVLNSGRSVGVKAVLCVLKTEDPKKVGNKFIGKGTLPLHKVGDIEIDFGGKDTRAENFKFKTVRNPIEELNALKAYCDRINGVYADKQNDCKTICEYDLMQSICGDCGEMEEIADAAHDLAIIGHAKTGHIYTKCISLKRRDPSYDVTGNAENEKLYSNTQNRAGNRSENALIYRKSDIIFPSEAPHGGALKYTRAKTTTDMGIRKVFDGANAGHVVKPSKTASSLKYMTNDISQAILSAINSEEGLIDGELPINLMIDMAIDQENTGALRKLQSISALKYHRLIRHHLFDKHSDKPKETHNFKIYLGSEVAVKQLMLYLTPLHGLATFSMAADEAGLYINLSFNNKSMPRPEIENLFRKIGPLVKGYGHKFATLSTL